ncbi:hypothetical protein [Petroclostridium sp. X23]|uniref:hypothetical protein n=1 Tax=Petroclostridium sp. X23 TaxID=3045146 RepID=UPI0024AE6DD0|nr:hypothetical protein [Petroclostridium sp. X23]WHH59285.1 hypothetical protein QKW49_00505 [Petroclostridium sp. X23]
MKDFKVLKLLDRFKIIFEKFGADYHVMRTILQVKLTMDGRRVPTVFGNSSKKKDDPAKAHENSFMKSLWFYGFIGLTMIPLVVMGENYLFQMSFVFGILMFMITTTLISDFSSVLLDVRDKNIILTKPVKSITLSLAKIIHVFIYMFFITVSLSGAALVTALIRHGFLFFMLFIAEVILMDLLIVVLTALLYLIVLKFFDGEKLKDIINYIQIGLSIAITIGYQLIGRLFSFIDIDVVFQPKWWQFIILPVWFGAPFELLFHNDQRIYMIAFSTLAFMIPIIAIMIYVKLIPSFERNLQKLNNNAGGSVKENNKLWDTLAKVICFNQQERVFLKFASKMMKNEREFKLKVYPSLGFALIFPFIFIFNFSRGGAWEDIASGRMYLNIYFCVLLLPTVVMMVQYSGKYKGAWIYKVMPIEDTAPIFRGTIKAMIVNLILPVYIIECTVFLWIFGFQILPDLIVVFLNIVLFTIICFKILKKALPFSQAFEAVQQQGWIVVPLMFLIGVFVGIHYVCTLFDYGVYIYMVAVFLTNVIVWKKAFNISWNKIINH